MIRYPLSCADPIFHCWFTPPCGVRGVGGHPGEGLTQLSAQFLQRAAVAGDPDDMGAGAAQCGGDTPAEAPAGPGDQRRRPGYFIPGHNEPPDSAPPLWRRPTHIDQPHSAESPRAQVAPCSRGKPNNPSSPGSRKVTIRAIPVTVTVGTVIAYAW